jgi:hypothetical protein
MGEFCPERPEKRDKAENEDPARLGLSDGSGPPERSNGELSKKGQQTPEGKELRPGPGTYGVRKESGGREG